MRELCRLFALAVAILLIGYCAVLVGPDTAATLLAGAAGVVVVTGLVLWSEGAVTVAAVVLVVDYVASLLIAGIDADPLAPMFAMLLVVFVEVADFAISIPPYTAVDGAFVRSRLRGLVPAMTATAAVSAGVLALAALPLPDATPVRGLGLLAAAGGVWFAARNR